jgi:SAM-dependent methyltransferase
MTVIREISLADTQRIYSYKKDLLYNISFDIKGFDYGWILNSRKWDSSEKVLDVGGAYSPFPIYLHDQHGCETWVVDDFGMGVGEEFWKRKKSPDEHIAEHPEVRYILERVGDQETSSLPQGYFDVVYSASALEHVPAEITPAVWSHMLSLLKPGGELIHAVDVLFPSNGGVKKMFQASLFDLCPWLFSKQMRLQHYLATPSNYARIACEAIGISGKIPLKGLSVWKMCLDPEILTESFAHGWNRIANDHIPNYHYSRVGSLLLHFQKK